VVGGCAAAGVSVRTPADRRAPEHASDREVRVLAPVLEAGPEKAAAPRPGLSHSTVKHQNARSKVGAATTAQLVWILAPRLPEPEERAQADE
jgi:hypothetical protein